jgi:hypothetical protein
MDTDLPVIYRMHTPEPDPKSRLERRKVAWRKGAPSLVTDEHREFVAKMALNAQETRQMNRELEVGRKRMESGQGGQGHHRPAAAEQHVLKPRTITYCSNNPLQSSPCSHRSRVSFMWSRKPPVARRGCGDHHRAVAL